MTTGDEDTLCHIIIVAFVRLLCELLEASQLASFLSSYHVPKDIISLLIFVL